MPSEVAEALGISVTTLSVWRCRRRYRLPYVKVGSRVMYEREAVEEFIRERTCGAVEDASS
jgi:predicted site-specific integrase-resolvase